MERGIEGEREREKEREKEREREREREREVGSHLVSGRLRFQTSQLEPKVAFKQQSRSV